MLFAVLVACAVTWPNNLIASVLGFNSGSQGHPSISITDINGHAVGSGTTVTDLGPGLIGLPHTQYHDNLPLDSVLEETVVNQHITDVKALQAWWMCSQVLDAESSISKAQVAAMTADPNDPPYNFGASLNAKSYLFSGSTNMSGVRGLMAWAHKLDRAAALARAAHIPCYDPSLPPNAAHWAQLTGKDKYGVRHLSVPDYAVSGDLLPLEGMAYSHYCVEHLQRSYRRQLAYKVDTKVHSGPPWDTYDTWDRAHALAQIQAEIGLAQMVQIPCSVPAGKAAMVNRQSRMN